MELKETVEIWKQKHGIMAYWKETVEPKPKDFLSKFLDGHDPWAWAHTSLGILYLDILIVLLSEDSLGFQDLKIHWYT